MDVCPASSNTVDCKCLVSICQGSVSPGLWSVPDQMCRDLMVDVVQ